MLRTIPTGKIHEAGNSNKLLRVFKEWLNFIKRLSSPSGNILFKKAVFYKPFTESVDREYTSLRVMGLQDISRKGPFPNSDSIRANYEETGVRLYAHVYRGQEGPSVSVFNGKFSQGFLGFYKYGKEVTLCIIRRDALTVYTANEGGKTPKIIYSEQVTVRTKYQKTLVPLRLSKPGGREMTWKEIDS